MTADTLQSKVFIGTLAAECNRDRRSIRAGMSVARRVVFATSVESRKRSRSPGPTMLRDTWGRPAGLAAETDIVSLGDSLGILS